MKYYEATDRWLMPDYCVADHVSRAIYQHRPTRKDQHRALMQAALDARAAGQPAAARVFLEVAGRVRRCTWQPPEVHSDDDLPKWLRPQGWLRKYHLPHNMQYAVLGRLEAYQQASKLPMAQRVYYVGAIGRPYLRKFGVHTGIITEMIDARTPSNYSNDPSHPEIHIAFDYDAKMCAPLHTFGIPGYSRPGARQTLFATHAEARAALESVAQMSDADRLYTMLDIPPPAGWRRDKREPLLREGHMVPDHAPYHPSDRHRWGPIRDARARKRGNRTRKIRWVGRTMETTP